MIKVGQNRGVLQIDKAIGEITLIEAMPEDTNNQRFVRATTKVKEHWRSGELPNKTLFASS